MIIALMTGEDAQKKKVARLILGLTEHNLAMIRKDRPIYKDGAEFGMPGFEVSVVYGHDEDALTRMFQQTGILDQENTTIIDRRHKGDPDHPEDFHGKVS